VQFFVIANSTCTAFGRLSDGAYYHYELFFYDTAPISVDSMRRVCVCVCVPGMPQDWYRQYPTLLHAVYARVREKELVKKRVREGD